MSLTCKVCNRKKPFPDVETFQHHIDFSRAHRRNWEKLTKPLTPTKGKSEE